MHRFISNLNLIRKLQIITIVVVLSIIGCTTSQISQSMQVMLRPEHLEEKLTEREVKEGLKEAMRKGTKISIARLSRTGGFLNHPKSHIYIPSQLNKAKKTLVNLGYGKEIRDFEITLNHSASKATKNAMPLIMKSIDKLKISRAFVLLKAGEHAATDYLRSETEKDLRKVLYPKYATALQETSAIKKYNYLVKKYNQIPFVQPIKLDINAYVTYHSIDGMFALMAYEEEKLREDPAYRDSILLQKVFAFQD